MNITAGEPVPPGFEDEVNREPEIQKAINQYKGNALVGLEYALELHEDDRREPGYFCVLCDKRGDPRTIMQHWTSYNHRLKYLEKHFPTAVREFNPVKYKPNSHQILLSVVQKLTKAIEDHHGRLKLAVANSDDFRRMKAKFVGEINNKFHFDERNGPNFLETIDRSLWEPNPIKNMDQTLQITIKAPTRIISEETASKSSNRDDLDEISSDSDNPSSAKKSKKREQSPAYRVLPRVRRSPPFEEERSEERKNAEKKLPTPRELSLQASHIAQEKYKWEKYRCMLEIQLKQMEKIQQDYDKNPEKHPLYPDEWKKFWNRRYKELQVEKKTDPNKYDYKPEWIAFWTKRMKDLFNTEIEKKKKEIKVKLGLPEDAEEKVDQLKEKYKVQIGRNAGAITSGGHVLGPKVLERNMDTASKRSKNAGDVINISDDESPVRRRGRRTRTRSRSRSHSHSRSRSRRSRSKSRGRDCNRSRDRSTSLSKSPLSDDYNPYPVQTHSHRHRHHVRSYVPPAESDYFSSAYPPRGRFAAPPSSSHYSATPHYRVLEPHQYPKYERSPSPSKSATAKEEQEPEDDGPLTVVSVLRLLTALEEHLGSLGPKVVDLLGKALALEKVKANSADDLLFNDDHVVFFETIKEKLKGILIADVLDDHQKVRAVKKAIKNIAAVIHQVTTKGNSTNKISNDSANNNDSGEVAKKAKKPEKLSVKDLPFDRQVVSTKLAAALVFQGREDVSTEDMDKLIFLFVLLVKISKEKRDLDGTAIQLGNVLSQLGIYVPSLTTSSALAALPALVGELMESEANGASTRLQHIDDDASNETPDKDTKNDTSGNMLESLTDSDLQTLLQNFKHLSSEEQHHLIAHLKKLETADPLRVEKLRKFVNLTDLARAASSSPVASTSKSNPRERSNTRDSRFDDSPAVNNSRAPGHDSDDDIEDSHRGVSVSNPNKFSLDDEDEDDDYNVDDVFKAAFRKVSDNSRQSKSESKLLNEGHSSRPQIKPLPEPIVPVSSSPNALTFNRAGLSLSDTQNLIANLMGSLQQSNSNQKPNANSAQSKDGQIQQIPTRSNVPVQPKIQKGLSQTQQQQQHQALQPPNMPYYQQGQQPAAQAYPGGGYNNQMAGMNNQTYYNAMGYNNNNGVGYPGYQSWGMGGDTQQYGMQNFMGQQQQQQPGQQQHMNYNMYGQGQH
ncbi:uncharacterized protein CG7065 [Anastrepha ludens]|uniref:uncharacterized protein CG7065 n=1 Tax=Anastrepha ludens TaxID=28586 RepID=UPI0023B08283|nr:uncharacterized protein CG7065 [Anastrepha ludens]